MAEKDKTEKRLEEEKLDSLKKILPNFSDVYDGIIQNEIYADISEEQVKKYF